MSLQSGLGRYARAVVNRLRLQIGPPPRAAEPADFVRFVTPCGRAYELSVEIENPDAYHSGVAGGGFEDCTWRYLYNWIRCGEVFFDLGANIGVFAVPAGIKGAQVHAFELLDSNVKHLTRAVERNGLKNFHIV